VLYRLTLLPDVLLMPTLDPYDLLLTELVLMVLREMGVGLLTLDPRLSWPNNTSVLVSAVMEVESRVAGRAGSGELAGTVTQSSDYHRHAIARDRLRPLLGWLEPATGAHHPSGCQRGEPETGLLFYL
jgi:hypothetical protein